MAKTERRGNREKETKGREKPESLLSRVVSTLGSGEEQGLKATHLLIEDHKRVKDLFEQYEKAEGATAKKKQLVEEISRELERGTERSPSRPRKPGARGGPRQRPAEA